MAKIETQSPFAPTDRMTMPPVGGVAVATACSAAGYQNRDNLLLCALAPGTVAVGALTRSKTASAPIEWCRERLRGGGPARALVVNAGNANAFTGERGRQTCQATGAMTAELIECQPEEVFQASTGVIAEPLSVEPFRNTLPTMLTDLTMQTSIGHVGDADGSDMSSGTDADVASKADAAWHAAAAAIMTTDTFPKLATRRVNVGGAVVTINGIAKGSGMIAPDMATMLAFIYTDVAIDRRILAAMTHAHCATTFNAITVDSDTSTSDTLLVFATGAAATGGAGTIDTADSDDGLAFASALHAVMHDLAQQIIQDGEGISKLIEVQVSGAISDASARTVGMAIANSPLVKTAVAGSDPNWGRIVMAVGKSGEPADRDRLAIAIGGHIVAQEGERVPDYDEAPIARHMAGDRVLLRVDLGLGDGEFTVWGCDLTQGYIAINADYRS